MRIIGIKGGKEIEDMPIILSYSAKEVVQKGGIDSF